MYTHLFLYIYYYSFCICYRPPLGARNSLVPSVYITLCDEFECVNIYPKIPNVCIVCTYERTLKIHLTVHSNVHYNVHMNESPISITEFRGNTKVFLDAAKVDAVTVRRGDDLYKVEYVGNVFTIPDVDKFASGASPTIYPEGATVISGVDEGWRNAGQNKDAVNTLTPACCLNKSVRCKHWDWDGVAGNYTNTNTGEVMEVGA